MSLLITSGGGEIIQNDKQKANATVLILDQNEDKKTIDQLKKGKTKQKVVSMQLVFEGILKQKLDWKKHSLI